MSEIMTYKQIIIDNVDVSDCGGYYFSPTGFHSCQDIQQVNNLGYEQDTLCEQNPNCNYKKLKRKEQECEELKNLLKVRIEDLCDSCGASSMMPMPCKVYEKTLTDIKQIMKKHCRKCKKHKFYNFKLCCTCKYTDIIQKISEVNSD